ncbi:MAG: type II toxin-antitoxin system HicA family toxin [Kiloniellales bacterium]
MSRADKLLAGMRANPKDDWTINQMQTVARQFEIDVAPPRRGSHYTLTHPDLPNFVLTIPVHRTIKGVYVKQFVSMMDDIMSVSETK